MSHPITIAVDRSAYRLERIDAALKVRRIGEIADQVGRAHAKGRIWIGFALIYRHLRKNAELLFAQFSRRKQQADQLPGK